MTNTFDPKSLFTVRNLSILVVLVAIGISGYLSYLKFDDAKAVCVEGGSFDCGVVLNSIYSEVANIPIAYLGLATNLIVLSMLVLEDRIGFLGEFGATLIFGAVLFAFLFSMYLIYVQAVLIESFCPWCLTHEALITVLFALSAWRFWRTLNPPEEMYDKVSA